MGALFVVPSTSELPLPHCKDSDLASHQCTQSVALQGSMCHAADTVHSVKNNRERRLTPSLVAQGHRSSEEAVSTKMLPPV